MKLTYVFFSWLNETFLCFNLYEFYSATPNHLQLYGRGINQGRFTKLQLVSGCRWTESSMTLLHSDSDPRMSTGGHNTRWTKIPNCWNYPKMTMDLESAEIGSRMPSVAWLLPFICFCSAFVLATAGKPNVIWQETSNMARKLSACNSATLNVAESQIATTMYNLRRSGA